MSKWVRNFLAGARELIVGLATTCCVSAVCIAPIGLALATLFWPHLRDSRHHDCAHQLYLNRDIPIGDASKSCYAAMKKDRWLLTKALDAVWGWPAGDIVTTSERVYVPCKPVAGSDVVVCGGTNE